MARKSSNSAEYFSHYVKHGQLLFVLESTWGNDGYAVWFKLLEMLTAAEGHFLDLKQAPVMAYFRAVMHVEESIRVGILDLLANLRRIDGDLYRDQQVLWCQDLVDGLAETLYRKRNHPPPAKPCFMDGITGAEMRPAESFRVENNSSGGISDAEIHIGRKEGKEGRDGIEHPPFSAPPALQERPYTKVDNLIQESNPMIVELLQIHLKATGVELKIPADEMADLLALFRKHDGKSVIAAYRLCQAEKPGNAFKFFLSDFAKWYAKSRQPVKPPEDPACGECHIAGGAHALSCSHHPDAAQSPAPPDDFEDDFPEASDAH